MSVRLYRTAIDLQPGARVMHISYQVKPNGLCELFVTVENAIKGLADRIPTTAAPPPDVKIHIPNPTEEGTDPIAERFRQLELK